MTQCERHLPLLLTSLVVTVLAGVGAGAAEPASRPAGAPLAVDQHGPTIKDACKNHFLIGTAGDLPGNYSDQEMGLVKENFNIVTPENCMKPAPVHPGENTWRFDRPDALVKWCADNKIAVHGHTLVWHAQTNDWFFRDGDKATVTRRLKDHISTLVGRYKGKIRSWDVVNEAINDGGNAQTAQTENLRNSSWLQALGPEFLTLAFKFAHEADPKAKLYYNDYGIEAGPSSPLKNTASLRRHILTWPSAGANLGVAKEDARWRWASGRRSDRTTCGSWRRSCRRGRAIRSTGG